MVALTEHSAARFDGVLERRALRHTCALRRTLLAGAGAALAIAATGIWLVPGSGTDAAGLLIRLLFSVFLMGLALVCLSARPADEAAPEIRIDTKSRRLSIVHVDDAGRHLDPVDYDIDDFAEFSLTGGALHARDSTGQPLIALPVGSKSTERAIRQCFDL
ncbi:hypothetical protein [Roseovarius sp. SYSU LYC5161]|uniref:hypothetical protein n=1 Tax=Roseovarius halophilus (ex Wu et al. 2025) TaxID=3376060 RepID=UPI00399C3269